MKTPRFPLRIFYDGDCIVCATEVEYYVCKDHHDRLIPVDISSPKFDAGAYGISQEEFMFELHALDSEGTVYRGVDAFRAIWQAFPAGSVHALLGKIISLPVINAAARIAYRGFARIRRYLPKRQGACADGRCRYHSGDRKK